jgi:hypothetical protein
VVADERSGSLSGLSSTRTSAPRSDAETQSASFQVGDFQLELAAAPGDARLVVSADGARDVYVVDPSALADWAEATARLLSLSAVEGPADRVDFRAPFLIDREGRASIAVEGLVSEYGVSYRLLVSGASDQVAGLMTTADLVREVIAAAGGAVVVARAPAS